MRNLSSDKFTCGIGKCHLTPLESRRQTIWVPSELVCVTFVSQCQENPEQSSPMWLDFSPLACSQFFRGNTGTLVSTFSQFSNYFEKLSNYFFLDLIFLVHFDSDQQLYKGLVYLSGEVVHFSDYPEHAYCSATGHNAEPNRRHTTKRCR